METETETNEICAMCNETAKDGLMCDFLLRIDDRTHMRIRACPECAERIEILKRLLSNGEEIYSEHEQLSDICDDEEDDEDTADEGEGQEDEEEPDDEVDQD